MAGSFTNYLENVVLDAYFTNSCYVGLYTVAPSETGGGTEVTGGSYARTSLNSKWAAAANGSKTTNADVVFPTASASWGTIVGFAIFDAVAGNMIGYGTLDTQKDVASGDTFKFSSGNLTVTLD